MALNDELKLEHPDARLEPWPVFTNTPYKFDGYAYGEGQISGRFALCPYRFGSWRAISWWAGRYSNNDDKPYRLREGWK